MVDYVALKAELLAGHPDTGAYNVDNQLAADELNLVNRTQNRSVMTGKEVKDEMDTADWDDRTDAQKSQLLALFARDDLDPFGIDQHIFQAAMAGAVGTSVASLAAARVRNLSRAEELFGSWVTQWDVDAARRATV